MIVFFYLVSKKNRFGSAGNGRPLSVVFVSPYFASQHVWKEFLHKTTPNLTFRPVSFLLFEQIPICT